MSSLYSLFGIRFSIQIFENDLCMLGLNITFEFCKTCFIHASKYRMTTNTNTILNWKNEDPIYSFLSLNEGSSLHSKRKVSNWTCSSHSQTHSLFSFYVSSLISLHCWRFLFLYSLYITLLNSSILLVLILMFFISISFHLAKVEIFELHFQ